MTYKYGQIVRYTGTVPHVTISGDRHEAKKVVLRPQGKGRSRSMLVCGRRCNAGTIPLADLHDPGHIAFWARPSEVQA